MDIQSAGDQNSSTNERGGNVTELRTDLDHHSGPYGITSEDRVSEPYILWPSPSQASRMDPLVTDRCNELIGVCNDIAIMVKDICCRHAKGPSTNSV